jgi:hypothetical protein
MVTSTLDSLYDLVDELGDEDADSLFRDLAPEELGATITGGMLTITVPRRHRLPHWEPFLAEGETQFPEELARFRLLP